MTEGQINILRYAAEIKHGVRKSDCVGKLQQEFAALQKLGFLEHQGWGDYFITQAGRDALRAETPSAHTSGE